MITVHHLNHSRSQRVLWLLEELELPYEIKFYERDPVTRLAPPSLKAVHPLGKSPVVVDDGVTVAETGAIVEYLVDKAGGRLKPRRRDARAAALDLLAAFRRRLADAAASPRSRADDAPRTRARKRCSRRRKSAADAARSAYASPNLKTMFDFIESELRRDRGSRARSFPQPT